jgi:hypothetical protein
MTRLIHRIGAGLIALWFTVVTVEPARLHSCPMHDGLAIATPEHAHGSHAGHMGHGSPESPDSQKHGCSCIGSCATASTPALPTTVSFEVVEVSAESHGIADLSRPAARVAFVLPFGNGPPRA